MGINMNDIPCDMYYFVKLLYVNVFMKLRFLYKAKDEEEDEEE